MSRKRMYKTMYVMTESELVLTARLILREAGKDVDVGDKSTPDDSNVSGKRMHKEFSESEKRSLRRGFSQVEDPTESSGQKDAETEDSNKPVSDILDDLFTSNIRKKSRTSKR